MSAPKYIMPMIVSTCHYCDGHQFRNTVMCHVSSVSVVKLDLSIQSLLLDHILAKKKYVSASRISCLFKVTEKTLHLVLFCILKTMPFLINFSPRTSVVSARKLRYSLCIVMRNYYRQRKWIISNSF